MFKKFVNWVKGKDKKQEVEESQVDLNEELDEKKEPVLEEVKKEDKEEEPVEEEKVEIEVDEKKESEGYNSAKHSKPVTLTRSVETSAWRRLKAYVTLFSLPA